LSKYETIVVSGGVMSLSVAYNLLRLGKRVHVLEARATITYPTIVSY